MSETTHQLWSCQVTLASNSENFYFLPNSILNFRKCYQLWGKLAQEQKVKGKKKNKLGGWKRPPVLIELRQVLFDVRACNSNLAKSPSEKINHAMHQCENPHKGLLPFPNYQN